MALKTRFKNMKQEGYLIKPIDAYLMKKSFIHLILRRGIKSVTKRYMMVCESLLCALI